MADAQSSQRKPSANKNIKKLRTVSMVCSLTSSWQKWVMDNEKKQSSEPSGWAPSWLQEPEKKPKKQWTPKKTIQSQSSDASENQGNASKKSLSREQTQKTSKTEEDKSSPEVKALVEPLVTSLIKTKQVEKTVTSAAKEKSAGIGLLTKKITKEALPSNEEIDRLLKKKSSPTRRRKCSNMVASLTQSWKQVEKLATEGTGPGERRLNVDNIEPKSEVDTKQAETSKYLTEVNQQDSEEDESSVRIKRPSMTTCKKEAEDANKINALSKKYSAVGSLKSRWQDWASEHTVNQRLNPFSEYFDYDYSMSTRLQKGQEGYGRPKEGTKTAERAKRAEQHIHREIDDMCYVIRTMVDPDQDGKTRITFGQLFERYVRISDKVVGILMRARKHGKVAFEGEMLWQGRDDGVIITLLV